MLLAEIAFQHVERDTRRNAKVLFQRRKVGVLIIKKELLGIVAIANSKPVIKQSGDAVWRRHHRYTGVGKDGTRMGRGNGYRTGMSAGQTKPRSRL